MKILMVSLVLGFSLSSFASSDCDQVSGQLAEVDRVLEFGKTEFVCDSLELISGNHLMGAGQSVLVDSDSKIAQTLIQQGYPPFGKEVNETLKLDLNNPGNNSRYVSADGKTTFQLTDEKSGTLSQKVVILGKERVEAFSCKVQ